MNIILDIKISGCLKFLYSDNGVLPKMIALCKKCNVCETLICKLVYLFIVFGEHGRYIGNINHLW